MFGEIDKLEEMKNKINEISPSFCAAKWLHVTLHLMNGHNHSCYLPMTHKVPESELKDNPSALHNSNYKKTQRKKMLNGERPKECSICWAVEDSPNEQISDRHYRSVDSWTMPFIDKISKAAWDENINPTYVELSFNSICNFKCSYCSPAVSTEWMKEIVKDGPYPLSKGEHQHLDWFKQNQQIPYADESNPYIEAFWKWWPELIKTLMFLRITGGEPLLSKDTFKLMNELILNPQKKLELSINSNLGVNDKQYNKFEALLAELVESQSIKNFILHTSLDTVGHHSEYIRFGLNFKLFEQRVDQYMTKFPKLPLAIMVTFNALSIIGFEDFLIWLIDKRKKYNNTERQLLIDIPHLTHPSHLSAQILTNDFQERVKSIINFMEINQDENCGIKKAEILKMQRIYEWMKSPVEQSWLEQQRKDFYLFFTEHDKRRGTIFLKTFPKMKTFYNLCQKL